MWSGHNLRLCIFALCLLPLACSRSTHNREGLIKVLILSGRNNHDWQKTTPILERIFRETHLFSVDITELPDTLTYSQLIKFDAIVSNWNTWPDTSVSMSQEWEKGFLKYVRRGGGCLFIHAGASSFYNWPEYHKIGIGRWGGDTRHGAQTKGKVCDFDADHPITEGLRDFYIVDEIWENADITPGAQSLATVTATDQHDGHSISEGAVFVSTAGRGRSFYTTLGHNERALLNSGLQTLLVRAAQWVSHRNVTYKPPAELNGRIESTLKKRWWSQSDTTLALWNDSLIVWQFNFNNRFGRPYFHPLCAKSSIITCASPPDHPWHLGFWFCWKFINGVNYWEYLDDFKSERTGYRSAGITSVDKWDLRRNPDYSADIHLELSYHPADSLPVMSELRDMHISELFDDGSYYIDHSNECTALAGEVILDRTPVQQEPGGRPWGGYAGLSIRFSEDYTSAVVIAPDEHDNYKKNDWVYMGFNTLSGDTAGVAIFRNKKFTTPFMSWYVINDPSVPFFYFSPAVLYDRKIILKKGQKLALKYRTWVLPGKVSRERLQSDYNGWTNN